MFSIYILVVYVSLVALRPTRRVALALMPWVIFACSYDAMRLYSNYMVNDIDVRQLYDTELRWFGIALSSGETVIPGAWFAQHHHVVADVMAGLFYLCWVPVPLAFALCLYFRGKYSVYLRFSIAFLVVNLIGFCGYYIHPAAPPWYALDYGLTPFCIRRAIWLDSHALMRLRGCLSSMPCTGRMPMSLPLCLRCMPPTCW